MVRSASRVTVTSAVGLRVLKFAVTLLPLAIEGEDRDDAGGGADLRQVEGGDVAVGDGRGAEGEVQGAFGQGNVVDIARLAGDMQGRGVMREGKADAHARTSKRLVGVPARSWK